MVHVRRRIGKESGFTIMELAAVLGILAVLTTLSIPTYNALRKRAFEAEARSFIQEIRVACWVYRLEEEEWPTTLTDIGYPSNYASKYFSYSLGLEGTDLQITAMGQGAAAGITVTGTVSTDGQIEISVSYGS